MTFEERFWKYVLIGPKCWIWTGKPGSGGYGRINRGGCNGRNVRAHRASWEIHYGKIPDGMWVLHTCDNPLCVRPDHLFLGTHTDNMHDCIRKNRHRAATRPESYKNGRMGRSLGAFSYSDDIIIKAVSLVNNGKTHREVAKILGVSKSSVGYWVSHEKVKEKLANA